MPFRVNFINKTILEDARDFVGPELLHAFSSLDRLGVRHQDTLDDPGYISQVEGVMEFCGGSSEILGNLVVDLDG